MRLRHCSSIVRVLWTGCFTLLLAFDPGAAQTADTTALERVADAIAAWDGRRPGDLFLAVKKANPDKAAIVSMRELNKAIADRQMPKSVSDRAGAIVQKQKAAQTLVRTRALATRDAAYERFRTNRRGAFRSVYGRGDIGSWSNAAEPDASMDIDWTVLGTDPEVTAELRDECQGELLRDLVDPDSKLTLADFDVVITAEGHEAAAGVFETKGGIDWAKRNMKSVTIIQPDGTTRTYQLGAGGDPVAEMAQAEHMARFRDLASKNGDYDALFDAQGFLKEKLFDNANDATARALWDKYTALLSDFGVDFYVSRSSTATGGCLDMAKHLQEEVLTKKHVPKAKLKKTLKYVSRADNISRGAPGLEKLLASDPLLSDPAYRDVVDLARRVTGAPDATVDALLKERFGDTPDAALQELGSKARRAILRMSELAFQAEMDRIVLEIGDKTARKAALDKLTDDFRVIAEEGGEYSDVSRSAVEQIAKMQEANESGAIEGIREHYQSLEKIRGEPGLVASAVNFLKQTELGRKMLETGGQLLEFGKTPLTTEATGRFRSSTVDFVSGLVDTSRAGGLKAVELMGSAAMWAQVLDDVRMARNNADLAIALSKTLVNNTFFGMILNSAYAGIVQGDNQALGKAVMYMLVPETALPALVEALGHTVINTGAQMLFETQMEGVYRASTIVNDQITDFGGLGMPGAEGAKYYVDAMADGIPELVAQDIIARTKSTEAGQGVNALAIRAVAASIHSTVENGRPLVFKSDGPLMAAAAGIARVTEDITDSAKAWGVEVALSAESATDLPAGLEPAQRRALVTLLGQRQRKRAEAKTALGDAMVRTFLERNRAEAALDSGKAVNEFTALLRIFEDLNITKEATASLDAEGAPYNLFTGWTTTRREKQVAAVKAVQKFKDAYSAVLEARRRAEEAVRSHLGSDYTPSPRPLTGSLPLTGKPELDVPIASSYLASVGTIGESSAHDLELIKRAKLDGDYDAAMLKRLYEVRLEDAWQSTMMKASSDAQQLHWAIEVFDKQALFDRHSAAAAKSTALRKADTAIRDEFRDHYAVAGAFVVQLAGPRQITSGEEAKLVAAVRIRSAEGATSAVPADVARGFRYVWRSGRASLGEGPEATRSYKLDTVGDHAFTVTVVQTVMQAGKPVQNVIGEMPWTVKVIAAPDPKAPGVSPPAGPPAPDPKGPGGAASGEKPPATPAGTPPGAAPAAAGAAAGVWTLQSVSDEKAPLGGQAACPPNLLTERNYWDEGKSKLRTEYTYYVDRGRTIRCGTEKRYYENGTLQYQATRINDAFEGTLTRYWGTGTVFDTTTFKNGAKNGPYASFWSNNKPRASGLFKDNRKVDAWSYFLASGALEAQGPYYRKFSTEVRGDKECPLFTNDPFALDEGLYWQCGNRFGKWTVTKNGTLEEQTFEDRGDIDSVVMREYWDRELSSPMIKELEGRLDRLLKDQRAEQDRIEKCREVARASRTSAAGCDTSGLLTLLKRQIEEVLQTAGDERERLYREVRAKYIVAGIDVEKPDPGLSSSAPTGTVTIAGNSASTSAQAGTSDSTWSDFPKTVVPGQIVPIRVVVGASTPGQSAGTFTTIAVQGRSDVLARAEPSQPVVWDGLAAVLFSAGAAPGGTKTLRLTHRGPGGTATRTYVYALAGATGAVAPPDPGKLSATISLASGSSRVILGQPLSVSAAVSSTSSTASAGALVYRWQPNPEVTFTPVEGSAPRGTAVFTRVGPVKLWVQVLRATGSVLSTVAESNQIDIEVVPPALTLQATPAEPYPGQEVRVTLTVTPPAAADFLDLRWEHTGAAISPGPLPGLRVFTFAPKGPSPVTATLYARARDGGDDVGKASVTVTAKAYDVTVTGPILMGPAPREWDPRAGGLVDVARQLQVFQQASMKVALTPATANAPRYAWAVSPEGCTLSNPASQTPTLSCSQPGSFDVSVSVTDASGAALGSGSKGVSVAPQPVGTSTAPAAPGTPTAGASAGASTTKKEAADNVTKAKQIVRTGELDEALTLVDGAATIDPTNTEARSLATQWRQQREICLAQVAKTKQLMAEGRYADASDALVIAKDLHPRYKPVLDADALLSSEWRTWDSKIQHDIAGIRMANERREFKRALDLAAKRRAEGKIGPYEQSLADQERWAHRWESEKEQKRQLLRSGEEKVKQHDDAGALKDFELGFADFNNLWAASDPEPAYYYKLRDEALARTRRVNTPVGASERPPTSSVAAFIKQGADLYEKNTYQPALEAFNKVLDAQPDSADAYAGRCLAKHGLQDDSGARADCDKALQLDARNADAYRGRSMIKRVANDAQGALADATRAVELAPSNYRTYLTRGLAREALNDVAGALADYTRSIEINRDYAMSYYYRGRARYGRQDYAGAVADYDRSIQLNPAYASSFFNRARAKYAARDYPGALADYDRYITMNATDPAAFNNRALVKERLGDTSGAIADYERAIAINPNYEPAKRNLAALREKLAATPASTGSSPLKSGRYHMRANEYPFDVILTVNGSTFEGRTVGGPERAIRNGKISGDVVTFHLDVEGFPQGQDYTGKIQGGKITGTFTGAPHALGAQFWSWGLDLTAVTVK